MENDDATLWATSNWSSIEPLTIELDKKNNVFLLRKPNEPAFYVPDGNGKMTAEYTKSALKNVYKWKRIHTLTERFLRRYKHLPGLLEQYKKAREKGIYSDESFKLHKEIMDDLSENHLPLSAHDFVEDICKLSFSKDFCVNGPVYQLYYIYDCMNIAKRNFAVPSNEPQQLNAILLMERIFEWLFDALHKADLIIETYLEKKVKKANACFRD